MIRIRVRFFSIYSDYASDTEFVSYSELSIRDLFEKVIEMYPSLRSVFESIKPIILVNGKRVGYEYVLRNGDEVAFIPPVSGG